MNTYKQISRAGIILGTGLFTALSVGTAAIARDNTAGIGYSSQRDTSYCSTFLISNDPGSRINIREGPGTVYDDRHHGFAGDWIDILNDGGNPNIWKSGQDSNGDTWYQVGFPESRAYGWVREDFLSFPPEQCRN